MNFSIIIPNYNGARFLPDCLSSLQKSIKKCPDSHFEIILVDNASVDDSVSIFKSSVENQIVIKNISNLGFAGAVNQGILKAKFEWVVLLNNDLTLSPNWFKLIEKNQQPGVSVYCGTVLNKQGTHIESQGLQYFMRGKCLNVNNGKIFQKSKIFNLKPKLVWGCSAALACYHKKTLISVGLFDQDFFAYEEDVDLAYRLNKSCLKTLYIPQALSYHLGGGTSRAMGNFRSIHDAQNWIYIIAKNYSKKEILKFFFPIIEERLRNLSGLIKATSSDKRIPTVMSTYWQTIQTLPKMIAKRKINTVKIY